MGSMREGPAAAAREPRASLRHSVEDGCAHAVMLGAGEAYLAAFGIFLGLGSLALGLLATLPLLVGSVAQLGAVHVLDRARARKPLVVWPALAQGLCWVPFALIALLVPPHGAWPLLAVAIPYYALGSLLAPPWNSWMGELVPPRLRGGYFGRREQLRQGFQLAALVLGGSTLALARRGGEEGAGFAVIFGLALLARLVSVRHLMAMEEPAYHPPDPDQTFTLGAFLRRAPWSNFGRFTVFVALIMAATNLSGPFFSLFMLRDLGFSYLQFTAASATVLVAQILTVRGWGRLGDRFGNRLLLQLTGYAIPVLPILWVVSCRFPSVIVWQMIGGVLWAGFNLSAVNFLFDAVSPPKRARCVAYYALLVAAGNLAGATLGGFLAPLFEAALPLAGRRIPLRSGLQVLFLVSGLSRLALAVLFLPRIREVRPTRSFGSVLVRVAGLAAARGVVLSVFNGVHPEERGSGDEP